MAEKNSQKKLRIKTVAKRIAVWLLILLCLDFLSGFFMIPDNSQSFRTSHYFYHHGLLPDKDVLASWGSMVYPVHTNSLGFVDSESGKVELKSETPRMLILGDSHSEGVGVIFERTFAGYLSSVFQGKGLEILNASCISYSPKIEYLKAKYLIENTGLDFDYLFVLIDISDLQNELVYEAFNPTGNFTSLREMKLKLGSFIKSHFTIYYMVSSMNAAKKQKEFMETASFFNDKGALTASSNTLKLYSGFFSHFNDKTLLSNPMFHGVGEWYYNEFKDLADRGLELGTENIGKLKKLCDSRGIRLIVSVHPWHTQIIKGVQEDYYVERWKNFCNESDIDFINLFPLFIDGANPLLNIDLYYIQGDNHWNEMGHNKVGLFLEKWINENIEIQ